MTIGATGLSTEEGEVNPLEKVARFLESSTPSSPLKAPSSPITFENRVKLGGGTIKSPTGL